MHIINQILWFLPWCWFVNVVLTVVGYAISRTPLSRFDPPLDARVTLVDGQRLFGGSRTWGGLGIVLILGTIGAVAFPHMLLFVRAVMVWVGDVAGSFIKRRFGFLPGTFLPGIDHGDYVLSAGLLCLSFGRISLLTFVVSYIITLLVTPFITRIGFLLKLRRSPL